jgi:hypothetical protein
LSEKIRRLGAAIAFIQVKLLKQIGRLEVAPASNGIFEQKSFEGKQDSMGMGDRSTVLGQQNEAFPDFLSYAIATTKLETRFLPGISRC